MNMKYFKKELLPLDIIVEELQLILKSYKEFQNSNIAKYFDNLFNKTIINYKLSRLELMNKLLGVKMANRLNFRAFVKPYNKVYKVHSIENDGTFAIQCFKEDGKTLLKRNDNGTNLFLFKQNEFDLMQSTGLTDKNNIEIFEEDIIKFDGKYTKAKRLIRYSEEEGRLVACYTDFVYDYCDFNQDWISQWEVIGNIYENPELLTK